ncbi:phospho-N-acetylmuramoyl-pentapeptide-transferase [Leadbettera azotonutricia]|uniref:Phospho-N-acetylmuramoyl-pentapeptide-transferase n=1 Tax=Leadbettera azotonutricia (strain ATCC BAA-888 / DSM 13862 / ZAS-9) TaxID=545695 RepID=F5Y8X8_LEAAZ|nr:phospho-N-acetylmuramoyl-pentapeptide-transferase [Leadbettera azotonutricia]AEF81548.1 phospho-N-acetylmuramoyl-pentapeptide-transferase [Leadbettera azotonutricia ZAS-9]
MFLEFIYPLVKFFTPLNVFQYLTFRSAYAALTTLLICFIFGPGIIEALKRLKVNQSIREDGPATHLKKSGTPTMGGIFIILSVIVSMVLWMDLGSAKVWLTLGAFGAFGLIGFIDDYLKVAKHNSDGLPAWAKLAGQFAIAIAVMIILYASGGDTALYIPFFKNAVIDLGVFWIPFGVILIVGESNAVNFSDGLDGLLAGLLILVFITLTILTYLSGRTDYSSYLGIPYIKEAGELTVFCLAAVGACIGFLWFNAHPADVFMGDVGSLSLGGVIAVISLIIKKEILILIIGGVFVLEIASVVIQVASYKLRKKRVFKMAPLHHHFELSGWAETKVVIRFWILGGLFAIIALSTLKIQ